MRWCESRHLIALKVHEVHEVVRIAPLFGRKKEELGEIRVEADGVPYTEDGKDGCFMEATLLEARRPDTATFLKEKLTGAGGPYVIHFCDCPARECKTGLGGRLLLHGSVYTIETPEDDAAGSAGVAPKTGAPSILGPGAVAVDDDDDGAGHLRDKLAQVRQRYHDDQKKGQPRKSEKSDGVGATLLEKANARAGRGSAAARAEVGPRPGDAKGDDLLRQALRNADGEAGSETGFPKAPPRASDPCP